MSFEDAKRKLDMPLTSQENACGIYFYHMGVSDALATCRKMAEETLIRDKAAKNSELQNAKATEKNP